MVGSIYIIKNNINNKVYIGQTIRSVKRRFQLHTYEVKINKRKNKMYDDMGKYGVEQFYYETLESNIPNNKLDDRERYYIKKYDSINKGYNIQNGGSGMLIYEQDKIDKIKELYISGLSTTKIAKMFNSTSYTINRTLLRNGIKLRHDGNKYEMFDKDKFIEMWNDKNISIADMAKYFNVNEKTIQRNAKRLKLQNKIWR